MAKVHSLATRRSAKSVADAQARDIERVVARSGVLASRLWRVAANAADSRRVIGAGGVKRVPIFDENLVGACVTELSEIMAYSYLLRRKLANRRRKMSKDVRLELSSPVHSLAAKVANQIDIDLGVIRKRFEPLSKKAISRSVSDIRDVMNRALANATREGLPTSAATDEVIFALRKHGIQPRSSTYIETLVRTHSAISYGVAHKETFANDPELWGFEYLTVGDDRVRVEHEELDGIARKKDDPFWTKFWPPNGWNCRCQAVAIYDEDAAQTRVPDNVKPDEGFDTDFSELL